MFSELIGNIQAKQHLRTLLRSQRVPGALLFTGPESVGKKHFAFEFARTLVCPSANDGAACGQCSVCRRVDVISLPTSDKGEDYDRVFLTEHPDVGLVIPFKRNLRVGAIRALEAEANFRPFEASARVFIVDDADKMNDAASNALLKTLEEPAATTHLILVTSRPDTLLPTIRSRCQTIRFGPVPADETAAYLSKMKKVEPGDAALIANIANGSIGRALSLDLDSVKMRRAEMLKVIKHALAANRPAMLRIGEQMNDAKRKDEFEPVLSILETLVRDVWLTSKAGDDANIVNTDLRTELADLAKETAPEKLAAWLAEIESMRAAFLVNINKKTATDALFVKMAA